MKKFLIVMDGILVMSMYSCSDEQATEQTQSETILKNGSPTTVSLYNAMVNSQNYQQLESMKLAFRTKMNYHGRSLAINTEHKMFAWINANIATTGFNNYNAAVGEWNAIKQLNRLVYSENQGFYSSLRNETNPGQVFYQLNNPQQQQPTNDPCGCQATFTAGAAAAAASYAADFNILFDSPGGSPDALNEINYCLVLELVYLQGEMMTCISVCAD